MEEWELEGAVRQAIMTRLEIIKGADILRAI